MVTIVVVNVNGTMLRVACDGLAKDQVVARNVVLTGCKELDTEGRDGQPLDTRVWSIPEALIVSYAMGKPYEAPLAESEPAEEPPPREPTPEEREAIRQRSVRIDTAARERRMQERAHRADLKAQAEAAAAASPVEPKRRGRPKKVVAPTESAPT
jgi:hypothetical protein